MDLPDEVVKKVAGMDVSHEAVVSPSTQVFGKRYQKDQTLVASCAWMKM